MKIAFLIPSTTHKRNWKSIEETYLFNLFIESFLNTISEGIEYTIYLYFDKDDKIYSKISERNKIFKKIKDKAKIVWINDANMEKGHLTSMWNYLFEHAIKDGNEYFYQCGDDIQFRCKDWIKKCITQMKEQDNIGICGPINLPNKTILTQTFVSRKHYEIFKFYFPNEIKNWFCDDWINFVYEKQHSKIMTNIVASNCGGKPRYNYKSSYETEKKKAKKLIDIGKKKVKLFLSEMHK